MATNAKTQAAKQAKLAKQAAWLKRFQKDTQKILRPGEEMKTHYIGSGQAFTKKV